MKEIETLQEHITRCHSGSRTGFASKMGVARQQVFRWLESDVMIYDSKLYLMRRPAPDQ